MESQPVPVVLRHNEQLELNLTEYHGSVSLAELEAVATFLGENPSFLKRDTLTVVLAGVDFNAVPLSALDDLFACYATLFAPISFQIVRRSAWLCLSAAAQAHVDYWIGGRDAREAMSSTLRQFNSHAEAGDWLVLTEAETIALETGAGFDEIARFDFGSAQAAAARR
ncbi:MAG: hypothetical protein ACT4OF_16305 [Caulobacteraceae bacterium]